jgi:asparagine synthase (glutamine-hydrolysing)
MSGIAGISCAGKRVNVERMLHKITHRGARGHRVFEAEGATLGAVWPDRQGDSLLMEQATVRDRLGQGHFAEACILNGKLVLSRDSLGVAPLYHGRTEDGALCFASEVKALVRISREVHELPPGCLFDGNRTEQFWSAQNQPFLEEVPGHVAEELHRRLSDTVKSCIVSETIGAWLSGGLDSSTMAALARPHVRELYTFAAGLSGAPDLEHAREVANFIGSRHHEVILNVEKMVKVLPDVIYHLESFDALLVRSSIANYLAAKAASEHVAEVFSGEGGDELFAGYEYLKSIDSDRLHDELLDITGRLHNTALQRVDRCASAHGLVAHVPFADPLVLGYALRIPVDLKLRDGVEKWILRRAMEGLLPERVLNRPKSKFWEGSGVGDHLARHAEERVSDGDFARERTLSNGWRINSKEELMYYRIFEDHYGKLTDLSWMGRTKETPIA